GVERTRWSAGGPGAVDDEGLEGSCGVSAGRAVAEQGVLVVVEARRDVVGGAGAQRNDAAESEMPGQVEAAGEVESMSLIVVRGPAFARQVVTVRRRRAQVRLREGARGVVGGVRERVR